MSCLAKRHTEGTLLREAFSNLKGLLQFEGPSPIWKAFSDLKSVLRLEEDVGGRYWRAGLTQQDLLTRMT